MAASPSRMTPVPPIYYLTLQTEQLIRQETQDLSTHKVIFFLEKESISENKLLHVTSIFLIKQINHFLQKETVSVIHLYFPRGK